MDVCVTIKSSQQRKRTLLEKSVILRDGESIFEALMRQAYIPLSFCGGKGMCGLCRIQYLTPAPIPKAEERKFFTPEELRNGMRLACLAYPKTDCEIVPVYIEESKLEKNKLEEENARNIVAVYNIDQWNRKAPDRISQIIAVDLGTTTIALQRIHTGNDQVLCEKRIMNPQRAWGADVISRMDASIHGKREELHEMTIGAIENAIDEMLQGDIQNREGFSDELHEDKKENHDINVIIAGNTVMLHILLGLDMTSLSVYPFQPVTLQQATMTIGKYKATLMPGISAFVGADITAGIYALQMYHRCQKTEQEKVNILLDLGTNGEIVMGNTYRMLTTATAAGPAFEGRSMGRWTGSDLISIVADLLDAGLVDETGLLQEPYFTNGYEIQGVKVTQEDIRALQMAKAAIHAGIEILMENMQVTVDKVEHVYLAGGFGYFLDVGKADRIGLLPRGLRSRTAAVGNTSLLGAYLYGKVQKSDEIAPPEEVTGMLAHIETINLATQKTFEEKYIKAMDFS
ncbi:MAG: ASKHA domain-containing protein [Lachnospiraceae bacterium]|nr:ASKHA domain-containing protein [Lachnospiraceae bacterium]